MYSLNMNNYPSNEETLIHSIVDDIYKAESKITEINQNQNEYNENNPHQKEIKKLEEKKEKLQKNLTEISSTLLTYISNNDAQIKVKQATINDLNIQINQLKDKLSQFNPINFQSLTLSKYILSNNLNDFLTSEQINDIIIDSKKIKSHENEILKYKKDIESYEINKNNILINIEELKQKEEQIKELLKMAKEEKLVVKDEIMNLISQKESLEEILKFKKLNMILINENMNNYENNNINDKIELFPYELYNLDINKTSNKLVEDIIEIIEINNNRENNILNSNGNNNLETLNNNLHISVNNNYLNNIIKGELGNYIKILKNKKNNSNKDINEFLNSLSKVIIESFISNISNNSKYDGFSTNIIYDYLLYFFKATNYDGIIENKLNFINKEYKFIKKERNKILENLFLGVTNLKSKLDDFDNRIKDINNQIKLFAEQNDIDEKSIHSNLTQNELSYIEISKKGNNLINEKNKILKEISEIENDSKKVKGESDEKSNETKNNIEKIEEQITELKNEIESEKLKSNQEIITLRKLIADKFNIIKTQLQIYKSKYGSNLTIYNRLVDSINTTIKSTYYKPLFGFERKNNYIESKSMIQDYNTFYSPRLRNFNQISHQPNSFISENLLTLRGNEMNESNINNNNQINYSMNEYQKIPYGNYNTFNNNSIKLKNKVPLSRSSHNIFINNPNNESSIDKSQNESKFSINRINISIDRTIPNHPSSSRQKQRKEISLNITPINYSEINNSKNSITNNNINPNNSLITKEQELNFTKNNNNRNTGDNDNNNEHNKNNKIKIKNETHYNDNNMNNDNMNNLNNNMDNINNNSNNMNNNNSNNINNNINNDLNNMNNINNNNYQNENPHHGKTISAYNPRTNYNLNNYENNKIWLEEREKLGKVIQNLKEKISKTEKISNVNNSLMNKLSPLTQITFCYYRSINGPYHKFNPLSNVNSNNLIVQPYNFIKSTISLNKRLDIIKIVPSTQLNYIDIKIENIENTIVNSMIKTIIEIHRNYRRFKVNNKNGNLEDFIEKEFEKYDKLSKNDISKCALNKSFNFSLLMNNNQRIEILLCSYEDFKMWVNGVAFIIKNKNEILKNIKNKDELIEK